jgi:hypothetical protein
MPPFEEFSASPDKKAFTVLQLPLSPGISLPSFLKLHIRLPDSPA